MFSGKELPLARIAQVRPILLSAPYATPASAEVRLHLPSGMRTCGLVEVTLEDGTTGLGEGYLAVFAPRVFQSIVELIAPHLTGARAAELPQRLREMELVCDYWSQEGAARHAIAAVETALVDACAKRAGLPAWAFLGGAAPHLLALYASGGDAVTPEEMAAEVDAVAALGLRTFKIRARPHQARKAAWTLEHAAQRGVAVAVDMVQNLAVPGQTVEGALAFLREVRSRTAHGLAFLEEALGLDELERCPQLRAEAGVRIAGGEIVTTARELTRRIRLGFYDYAQPDATVIGGMQQTMRVFAACREHGAEAVVHCWGAGVGQMANYHAAFAGGGRLAEWPMPRFELRDALLAAPLCVRDGALAAPQAAGLGVRLTPEIERAYAFRPEAVYHCLARPDGLGDEAVWTSGEAR